MLEPMELAHLTYKNGKTYEDYLGCALERMGKKKWRVHVAKIAKTLKAALEPITCAGRGNSKKLKKPPRHAIGAMKMRSSGASACGRNSEA